MRWLGVALGLGPGGPLPYRPYDPSRRADVPPANRSASPHRTRVKTTRTDRPLALEARRAHDLRTSPPVGVKGWCFGLRKPSPKPSLPTQPMEASAIRNLLRMAAHLSYPSPRPSVGSPWPSVVAPPPLSWCSRKHTIYRGNSVVREKLDSFSTSFEFLGI